MSLREPWTAWRRRVGAGVCTAHHSPVAAAVGKPQATTPGPRRASCHPQRSPRRHQALCHARYVLKAPDTVGHARNGSHSPVAGRRTGERLVALAHGPPLPRHPGAPSGAGLEICRLLARAGDEPVQAQHLRCQHAVTQPWHRPELSEIPRLLDGLLPFGGFSGGAITRRTLALRGNGAARRRHRSHTSLIFHPHSRNCSVHRGPHRGAPTSC